MREAIEPISIEKTEIILNQMKRCICSVYGKNIGTGFFCKILLRNELIPVLITAFNIIDDNYIENNREIQISINGDRKIININPNSKIYSSVNMKYSLMLIKINDREITDFLELDPNIFSDKSEEYYENVSIYTLHCLQGDKSLVSYGKGIHKIDEFDIKHLCFTGLGSSGGPILSLSNNKVIGVHKGTIKNKGGNNFKIGTFLKYPLLEINGNTMNINLFNQTKNQKEKTKDIKIQKNEIKMTIKIDKNDINKYIHILDNTNGEIINGIKHYHDNLKELNSSNTELFINNTKHEFKKYFRAEKEGLYSIILNLKSIIKDCTCMFFGCKNIINIDFSSFDTESVKNMGYMFYGCENLTNINLSFFKTINVINMEKMFFGCINLSNIYLYSFDTKNVTNIEEMFCGCENLIDIDLSSFNLENVDKMEFVFASCYSLKTIKINKQSYLKIKSQIDDNIKIIYQ